MAKISLQPLDKHEDLFYNASSSLLLLSLSLLNGRPTYSFLNGLNDDPLFKGLSELMYLNRQVRMGCRIARSQSRDPQVDFVIQGTFWEAMRTKRGTTGEIALLSQLEYVVCHLPISIDEGSVAVRSIILGLRVLAEAILDAVKVVKNDQEPELEHSFAWQQSLKRIAYSFVFWINTEVQLSLGCSCPRNPEILSLCLLYAIIVASARMARCCADVQLDGFLRLKSNVVR